MKILGNRILVSKVEEEKKEGFQAVEVQDSFVYKGKVEQVGSYIGVNCPVVGDNVLFAKYSPDTETIKHEGKEMKIVTIEDILAIL